MSLTGPVLDFFGDKQPYQHWHLDVDAPVATLSLAVKPDGGFFDSHELKLNSYDIGVYVELADAVRRIRFCHADVRCVVITSKLEGVFCAGANIGMLASVDHAHKVNFCKYTNEVLLELEDASANSGIKFLAAVNGACSGGGYELALACDHIVLIDDRSTAVSMPEVPLLGVLPGTGGLTRLTDKRHVRRDLVDVFATRSEGCRGKEALAWGLVDELAVPSKFDEVVAQRASALAAGGEPRLSDGEAAAQSASEAIVLPELDRGDTASRNVSLEFVSLTALPEKSVAELHVSASDSPHWLLQAALELDAVLCHLRFNEPELGTLVISTSAGDGAHDPATWQAWDRSITSPANHAELEMALLWARTLRRLDLMPRSIIATIEPQSCCVGVLTELALAADRTYMLDGMLEDAPADSASSDSSPNDPPSNQVAQICLTQANLGSLAMSNGISRLQSRFWGNDDGLAAAQTTVGEALIASDAAELGLVTAIPDDLDWDDELRLAIEERASFSGDALTGLEANSRFCGPETMATKIFGRLSAWQNWIFARPNAAGPNGALQRYGTGARPEYSPERV